MGDQTRLSDSSCKGLEHLSYLRGAEELLKIFVETNTLVLLGKIPMEVTTELIIVSMILIDEGITQIEKSYAVAKEILKKGSMHQVNNVLPPDRRA